eukprot:COSAG01_NODE_6667_length_3555_cov_33.351273_2_plen_62_part_00
MQRGGRPGLSGMRAVDAVIIASARMREAVAARSSSQPCTRRRHAPGQLRAAQPPVTTELYS